MMLTVTPQPEASAAPAVLVANELLAVLGEDAITAQATADGIPTSWIMPEDVYRVLFWLKTEVDRPHRILYDLTAVDERMRIHPLDAPASDFTIVYGYTLQLTLQAAEQMKRKHGVDVAVIDLRTHAPLEAETFLESVAKTSRTVIVHEDDRALGVGAEVADIIAKWAFNCLDAPILRVAAPVFHCFQPPPNWSISAQPPLRGTLPHSSAS